MTVKGDIDEIRFRNDDNGYTILVLDNDGEPLVCVGTLPPVSEGECLTVTGDFVVHPRFGRQFKIKSAHTETPDTPDSMIRYLGSGVIKGIGPKLAFQIVEKFGRNALDVMENAPMKLATIRGISKKKAEEFSFAARETRAARESVMFLGDNNISLNLALKIYKQYGAETVAKVKSNPYRLIEDIDGVGFLTADRIARDMGFQLDSDARLRAGLVYVLRERGETAGNTYLPETAAYEETARLLGVDGERLPEIADALVLDRRLKKVEIDGVVGLMTVAAFRAEQSAADRLVQLLTQANRLGENVDDDIAEFERVNRIKLAAAQAEAVRLAASAGVAIITGGPGTGKTTIVKCILSILKARNKKVALMAPTGRAAKRLQESTGDEASTVHRALASLVDTPLKVDTIVIDEFSMVDVYLLDMLLKAVAPGTNLLIVGDKDQLPSVGAGNVLSDMLGCGLIPFVTLDAVYRQADTGLIIENAHRVNSGEMPILNRNDSDFFFMREPSIEATAATTVDLVARRLPKYLGCDATKVQVLCPMKNGDAGVIALNRRIQAAVNPDCGQGQLEGDFPFRVGDKVMHTANNYQLEWRRDVGFVQETGKGVFNGDLGFITAIDRHTGEITVTFEDGRTAVYTGELKNQLIPAYAITVHKSQGSEFDAVVLPIVSGSPMILTRNLLYTAITRAKRMVVLVGEEYHIKRMVDNNYIAKRYSCLKEFLTRAYKKDSLLFGVQ